VSRLAAVAIGLLLVGFFVIAPVAAAPAPDAQIVSVDLVPIGDTVFTVDEHAYGGVIRVRSGSDGLILTERVTLDRYLAGIREVPFAWPEESLEAQVVAARTYLAYTLLGGRRGNGAAYGYDICATSACQVYAGTGLEALDGGDRWVAAVDDTARQILLYRGRPAQTVYSSSAGSRTRANQDVWGGPPLPYLQPVDSPEDGVSPYATWRIEVPPAIFIAILRRDGHEVAGDLESVLVRDPGEAEGEVTLWIDSEGGTVSVAQTDLKGAFNRQGRDLAPGLLPSRGESGARLPQALPSYTYDIAFDVTEGSIGRLLPSDDLPAAGMVVITGEGWGHGVGLSQYGAKAMADAGASSGEILAHYYGGLEPVDGGGFVPDDLVVGLGWRLDEVEVSASGPFELRINGVTAATFGGGGWVLRPSADGVAVVAPDDQAATVRDTIGGRPWPR